MWKAAIEAIQVSNSRWISNNRGEFQKFFSEQNEAPRGKLKEGALEHHYANRLFKIFLSEDFDGLELSLAEGSRLIENATALEANWGWLLAIGTGGAYFADYMPLHIAEKYFLPPEALVAGSGKPDGKAENSKNGSRRVSGSWSYCSGSEQASLFTAVTAIETGISAVILPVDEVEIIRDWNAIGLPLTCSHTIRTEKAEIPEDHFFDLSKKPRPSHYPLSSYPFPVFARACFIPVIVGISRIFWEEIEQYLLEKEEVWKEFQPDRLHSVRMKQQNYWQGMTARRTAFYDELAKSWLYHLEEGKATGDAVSRTGLDLAAFCFDACAEIFPKLGMRVLERQHPIAKSWLDLNTAWQHSAFHPY